MDTTIIAILVIVLIAIAALWAKRWIGHRQHGKNEDKIPLFNCSVADKGTESDYPKSPDIYDCVEADKDAGTPDQQVNDEKAR